MSTLLVVDDEPSVLNLFRRTFEKQGARVVTAESLADGLAKFEKSKPDVIVLDVLLPDGSGLDLYQQIKDRDATIPVIFVTGHGDSHTAIGAMRLGALD